MDATEKKRGRPRKDAEGAEGEGNKVTPSVESSPESGPRTEGSPVPLTQRDTTAGAKAKYISLKIDADGSLDLSKMKDKGKAELREAILKSTRKGDLGPAEVPETFTPQSMVGYVAVLMGLESQAVTKVLKIPAEITSRAFAPDPAEIMSIAGPAARVANKYLSDFKYADEMALLGAIANVTYAKIQLCFAMTRQMEMEAQRDQKINGASATQ